MAESPRITRSMQIAGVAGIVFALLGCTGDVFLLYNPEGGFLDGDYLFLQGFSAARLAIGHYLGILFIPLSMAGMYMVYEALKPAGKTAALAAVILALYITCVGVAYHGTIAFIGEIVNGEAAAITERVDAVRVFSEPLAAGLGLGGLALSGLFVALVLTGNSRYPKWVAAANPVSFYALWGVLYFAVPVVGNLLIVAGFNLAMACFYALSLLVIRAENNG